MWFLALARPLGNRRVKLSFTYRFGAENNLDNFIAHGHLGTCSSGITVEGKCTFCNAPELNRAYTEQKNMFKD